MGEGLGKKDFTKVVDLENLFGYFMHRGDTGLF